MTATLPLPTLYDLGDAQAILDEFFLEAEGEETPELAALWESLSGQIDEKIERWGLWLRGQKLQAELIKAEEDRLRERRRVLENAIERSKEALRMNMERIGVDKVKGQLVTVRVQRSNPAVKVVLSQEELSAMRDELHTSLFVKTVPESYSVDTDYVKAVWKNGAELPAGISVEQNSHIRIQ